MEKDKTVSALVTSLGNDIINKLEVINNLYRETIKEHGMLSYIDGSLTFDGVDVDELGKFADDVRHVVLSSRVGKIFNEFISGEKIEKSEVPQKMIYINDKHDPNNYVAIKYNYVDVDDLAKYLNKNIQIDNIVDVVRSYEDNDVDYIGLSREILMGNMSNKYELLFKPDGSIRLFVVRDKQENFWMGDFCQYVDRGWKYKKHLRLTMT